ncbi:TPA: hypothetical protein N0F65_007962 [Lagenidium giganteum]|uniref:Uncharacterized protein n=1 Tax=Lagenidium giganteum TaxID=4803 RepID=A0AAV2YK13_9STRA|nr:TPA: hypothetical protein N0F65_007962 [Lagenidium giganteum]
MMPHFRVLSKTAVVAINNNRSGKSGGDPNSQLFSQRQPGRRSGTGTPIRLWRSATNIPAKQLFNLLRRWLAFSAAVLYVAIAFSASIKSLELLIGQQLPTMVMQPYTATLLPDKLGNATLRESPLVTELLQNDTTPRSTALFLDAGGYVSVESCNVATLIHRNPFIRSVYAAYMRGVAKNATVLTEYELITPVVDCSASSIRLGDRTTGKFNLLLRRKDDPDDVALLSIALSNQMYSMPARCEQGPVGLSVSTLISDMRENVTYRFALSLGYPYVPFDFELYEPLGVNDEGWWELRRVPPSADELAWTTLTARRTGFYRVSETAQSNINNNVWMLDTGARDAIGTRHWVGKPVLRDSWAWVHCIHLVFALQVSFHLVILMILTYNNLRMGKLWLGEPFVAISTKMLFRCLLVLFSWLLDAFWSLTEFVMSDASELSSAPNMFIEEDIMHADLLTIYLSVVGVLANGSHERVDPALAFYFFELGYRNRLVILQWFPTLANKVISASLADYVAGNIVTSDDAAMASPMRMWGAHVMGKSDPAFIAATLFFFTLVLVVVYIGLRKLYRRYRGGPMSVERSTAVVPSDQGGASGSTLTSTTERSMSSAVRCTNFELATGAALQNQFGLVCDYDNYRVIKGMQYASADGIYANGYVIVGGRFLVQTDDLLTLFFMKLSHMRFRKVYIYDVNQSSVQPLARLAYPHTMSYRDLVHLSLSVLS